MRALADSAWVTCMEEISFDLVSAVIIFAYWSRIKKAA